MSRIPTERLNDAVFNVKRNSGGTGKRTNAHTKIANENTTKPAKATKAAKTNNSDKNKTMKENIQPKTHKNDYLNKQR